MHISVLKKEILEYLDPKPNDNLIDCTLDGGGHTLAILEKNGPKGKVLGIDQDADLIKESKERIEKAGFKGRLVTVCDNFANLKAIANGSKFSKINGILFDLGMSSSQLEESKRGFSFLKQEPLDMRYGMNNPLTAEKIVNYWSPAELERILRDFGEESFAPQIVKEIVLIRKLKQIKTTAQLVEIIRKAVPERFHHQKIHFATKTFQALRMAVNGELENLERALPQALEMLSKEGRLAVISFHSLEDRIVKNFFRDKEQQQLIKIITKKPITPTEEELKINPRSRSSKLRAAIKL